MEKRKPTDGAVANLSGNGRPATSMTKSQPGVSIIMSVGDDERFIRDCIAGILYQEVDVSFELIAVRKRSGDNAMELLRDFTEGKLSIAIIDDPDDRELNFGNRTPGAGLWLAEGLKAAKADYVIPLRAQDWWSSPHLIADQIELLTRFRVAVACAAACVENDVHKSAFERRASIDLSPGAMITTKEVLAHYAFGHLSGVMFRRSALESVARDVYRLPFFERFVLALAAQKGIVMCLEEEGVVERVNVDRTLPGAKKRFALQPNMQRLTSAAAMYAALSDFDVLTEGQWSDAISGPREHALGNLRS